MILIAFLPQLIRHIACECGVEKSLLSGDGIELFADAFNASIMYLKCTQSNKYLHYSNDSHEGLFYSNITLQCIENEYQPFDASVFDFSKLQCMDPAKDCSVFRQRPLGSLAYMAESKYFVEYCKTLNSLLYYRTWCFQSGLISMDILGQPVGDEFCSQCEFPILDNFVIENATKYEYTYYFSKNTVLYCPRKIISIGPLLIEKVHFACNEGLFSIDNYFIGDFEQIYDAFCTEQERSSAPACDLGILSEHPDFEIDLNSNAWLLEGTNISATNKWGFKERLYCERGYLKRSELVPLDLSKDGRGCFGEMNETEEDAEMVLGSGDDQFEKMGAVENKGKMEVESTSHFQSQITSIIQWGPWLIALIQ